MDFEQTMVGGSTAMSPTANARNWYAPEMFGGHGVGRKADVWAFAMTIYELLTRGYPFEGLGLADLMRTLLVDDERPRLERVEDPAELSLLVKLMCDCWSTRPHERPSFEAIAARLAARRGGGGARATCSGAMGAERGAARAVLGLPGRRGPGQAPLLAALASGRGGRARADDEAAPATDGAGAAGEGERARARRRVRVRVRALLTL